MTHGIRVRAGNKILRLNKDGSWDKRFKDSRGMEDEEVKKVTKRTLRKVNGNYTIFGLKRRTYRLVMGLILLISFAIMGMQILSDSSLKVTKCADVQGCYYHVNREEK
jgi:hypothetical protein